MLEMFAFKEELKLNHAIQIRFNPRK